METPEMEKSFYARATPRQLQFVAAGEENLNRQLSGSIHLYAPESVTHLGEVDPRKIGRAVVARKFLRDVLKRREERGHFSWTLSVFPTMALARQARMSLKAYTRQIAAACFLEHRDPVSRWQAVHRKIGLIKKWLDRMPIERLHVESDTIDLMITTGEERKWLGLSGRNIPSFEVFISPDWRGTRGLYHADQPCFRSGNHIAGVRLEFKKGEVVSASARKGRDFLRRQLEMDRGAKRVGEFSLTDRRFSRIGVFMANTLYDENFGGRHGNCHVALVTSGTATLDTAIMAVPMVVVYKVSPLSYRIGKMLIKTSFIGLANLVAGEKVVPELIQHEAAPERLADEVLRLIEDKDVREKMITKLIGVRKCLGEGGASERTARIAAEMMGLET
jgi:aminopeptidase